jgi:CheY-like chemotaxis protein
VLVTEPAAPETPAPDSTRVLVADDNPLSAELLRNYLESLGYLVDWARDGDHALALAASGQYAVMLLDVEMRVYDGAEVMRRLHLLMGRRVGVIAMAKRMASSRVDLKRMGIDGVVTKPLDLHQLQEELTRVLRQRGS